LEDAPGEPPPLGLRLAIMEPSDSVE
jgi:hypothetical protein